MSVMEYNNSRRCLPHNLSYPNYIYSDRNAPLALAHNTRENPRGYPMMGGPVGGMHSRASMEEPLMGTGPARRRIAVACARCRKRKIRCSGDPGNGSGCANCRAAGVDPSNCQFHRVGSDHVNKVMEDRNIAYSLSGMANGHSMMPIYATGGNSVLYSRPMSTQQYSQLDTKPVYQSGWALPYSEDTSPVDAYSIDQPTTFLPQSTAIQNTSMCQPSYRWAQPIAKSFQHGNTYCDQDLHFAHANARLVTPSDVSPLNTGMSALQVSIPERPHPRQPLPLDSGAPQRQLPIPQPSPAQTNRNVVDQLQDARLRSAQAIGTSTMDSRGSFAKPLVPWTTDSENNVNPSVATDDVTATTTAAQLGLNFSTSGLLDGMSAPVSTTNYSYVRETRPMARPASQTSLYSYSPDASSKRNSTSGESPNDCALVSGHRYTPLSHSQTQSSPGSCKMHRDSCQDRNLQAHHTSMGSLNSTY